MNFIQVSCLVAQAQCLTNWGDCGLLYNAYLKNLQAFTRKGQRFVFFTLSTLSYLIPILQWRLIWGWILTTDSPLFRTTFSKAFQCSCAFFELMHSKQLYRLLAYSCLPCKLYVVLIFIIFLSSKCIIRVGIDMQHQNLCNGCFHESSLTNCKKEFKKAEHLFKK